MRSPFPCSEAGPHAAHLYTISLRFFCAAFMDRCGGSMCGEGARRKGWAHTVPILSRPNSLSPHGHCAAGSN